MTKLDQKIMQSFIAKVKAGVFNADELTVVKDAVAAKLSELETVISKYETLDDFQNEADSFMTDLYEEEDLEAFIRALAARDKQQTSQNLSLINKIKQNIEIAAETRVALNELEDDGDDIDTEEYDILYEKNEDAYNDALKQIETFYNRTNS